MNVWFHITPSSLQQEWTTEQKLLGLCQRVDARCWSDRFITDWLALGPQPGRQQDDCHVWAGPLMKSRHSYSQSPSPVLPGTPTSSFLTVPSAPRGPERGSSHVVLSWPHSWVCTKKNQKNTQTKKTPNPNEPHLILVAARRGSLGCLSVAAAPVLGTGSALLVAGHLWQQTSDIMLYMSCNKNTSCWEVQGMAESNHVQMKQFWVGLGGKTLFVHDIEGQNICYF